MRRLLNIAYIILPPFYRPQKRSVLPFWARGICLYPQRFNPPYRPCKAFDSAVPDLSVVEAERRVEYEGGVKEQIGFIFLLLNSPRFFYGIDFIVKLFAHDFRDFAASVTAIFACIRTVAQNILYALFRKNAAPARFYAFFVQLVAYLL